MRSLCLALVLAVSPFVTACHPAALHYTIRIESDPPGAKVYDPRTDEVLGETPYEVPVEYRKTGIKEYVRKASTLDQFTPQDPRSKEPPRIDLDSKDSLRVLVVKDGYEKLEQTIDWWFSDVDGQVVKKHVFLRPVGKSPTSGDDVYR